MVSKTKVPITHGEIQMLFESAGIDGIEEIAPLGAGEYNAVFRVRAKGESYAIKIAPSDDATVMTYEKDLMASELYWYQQTTENTSVPVPRIIYSDLEKKQIPSCFFIMEFIPGQQLDKFSFPKGGKENADTITARILAQLHGIQGDQYGYIQNGLHDSWYGAIRSMVSSVIHDAGTKGKESRRGLELLEGIDRHRSILEKAECTMVSFDMWAPNVIVSPDGDSLSTTWIDPERGFWGDPIMDFICLETTKPLSEKKASIEAYNSVAAHPVLITEEEKVRYAVAQGYLSLIFEVEKYFRYSPSHFGWWRNSLLSGLLFKPALRTLGKSL